MLLGVVCLEKGKDLKASANLQGDGGKKALLHELYTCSLQSSGCIDRAKCCLFALLSMKIQQENKLLLSLRLPCQQELFTKI